MTFIIEVTNPYSAEELVERFECETATQAARRYEEQAGYSYLSEHEEGLSKGVSYEAVDDETGLTVTAWRDGCGVVV